LLYAQREHLKSSYPDYDPARQDLWEQHNRPWDYDHILASKIISGKWHISSGVREWVNSIANLRAWPTEDNRSDQYISPVQKLSDENKLSHEKKMNSSFINEDELNGFQSGYEDIRDPHKALEFIENAKTRLLRIYDKWYTGLGIDFLT
jgi:hypothetical protein